MIGCGIIGLEMATVYDALGSKVTMVELLDQLIPGCDPDLVKPLHKRISARYEAIHLGTKVESVEASEKRLEVSSRRATPQTFDGILVAIGRRPNGRAVGADRGRRQRRRRAGSSRSTGRCARTCRGSTRSATSSAARCSPTRPSHEGKVAAEVIAGVPGAEFDPRAIPSVAYTDPEVAWMGLTETAARADGIEYEKAVVPVGRVRARARRWGATRA